MDVAEDEVAEILDVIVDCSDPERLAAFWSEVLRRPIEGRKGPYIWLERRNDVGFGFQRVTETRMGKNRVHVDVGVADLLAAKSRIEELGGRRAAGYERGGFLVMQDPEGNEFCLVPLAPFNFDDEGRADYLDGLHANDR